MLKQTISIHHNGLYLEFAITTENQLKFLHMSRLPFDASLLKAEDEASDWTTGDRILEGWPLVQLEVSGLNHPYERPGTKRMATAPGYRMTYVSHADTYNEKGRLLTFVQEDKPTGLRVTTYMQFYGDTPVLRCYNHLENAGSETQTIEYLSSFFYQGLEKEGQKSADDKMRLSIPHNGWMKELNWKTYTFPDLGLQKSQRDDLVFTRTSQSFVLANTGHWSAKKYLPMGYLENTDADTSLFWQIEHNGSWTAELADYNGHFCLSLSGPTELESHWFIDLKPGESFQSVPVAAGAVSADFSEAMAALTSYRRKIRRPNRDNEELPVIFNDYMNCLFADPTTEKEIPLIDAAAEIGCEYYVIDAGWYDDGFWWDNVGLWKEGRKRFPEGMAYLTNYIRSKGMIPGVWLELEVMGIKCPLAEKVPEEWFFKRHGKKVYDRSRYQLDFRHPGVIAHVNEVVRRVVEDYGCGYIKMDYNIEPGMGTELDADSFGDGLLQHERAYLNWLEGIFKKYPDLVIENCSSGGLRMDYGLLSRQSIQSTSDNDDYRMYATIAANAPSGVTPEQAAIWCYPKRGCEKEETIFNMVNALLLRIHQSGNLTELKEESYALVKEGIRWYKEHRHLWKEAVPYWPMGYSDYRDLLSALAMECNGESYLAVWKRDWSECIDEESRENICNVNKEHTCKESRENICNANKDHICKESRENTCDATIEYLIPLPK
ncbi:MAG: alpha-galactosidase, partial [Lachnospiraceae bacterium]|nr:alpha-galactosidase [Lachnospiraceae bacterium]